jgi:putative RNA 2'-phosphotransferase
VQAPEPNRLFKTLCYALRHDPWPFGLELTDEGFTPLANVVSVIRQRLPEFREVPAEGVEQAIRHLDPERFEVRGTPGDAEIRARYGHSFPVPALGEVTAPPVVLYHGTSEGSRPAIEADGLRPVGRYFLHLTTDRGYATRVGTSKGTPFLWQIRALDAFASGIVFRRATPHVWLTGQLPLRFLTVEPSDV